MTFNEGFLLLIRWFHALAAVTWVGGSLFYVLVLRPQQRRAGNQGTLVGPEGLAEFRGLVDTCMAVLLVTGAILLFDRITDASTTPAYMVIVSIKIGLALWMFAIARGRWQRRRSTQAQPASTPATRRGLLARAVAFMSGVNMTVVLGIAVFLLSDLLAFLFEKGLTGR
ncbi:MAG: hypothetical protein HY672_01290 [Chloroflexi bacterium]|nr:hypothetical protein [Chloroflexota bacterium]